MKIATVQFAALFAIVAMTTACGTETTTTTTAVDSGSTATDAGADAGTDAGTTTDAGTATDAGATAKYGKGCTSADDQAFLGGLQKDAAAATAFAGLISNCTLKKGCLALADAPAKQACITKCIVEDKIATDGKMSNDCASCYGVYKGFCGADKCIAKCAADPQAQKCSDCLATNCDPEYNKCLAGDK